MLSNKNRSDKGNTKSTISSKIFNELAAKNVKKSSKDYFIYFFTLMLSVCLFYSFNSISTQFAALGLEDRLSYLSFSSSVLTAFSVLVCFIMGALVVYANRFMLRRRKKEMGIYATLGMERRDLNHILMKETLKIGVVSLAAGIVFGIFAAQILSLVTAKLAGLSLESYHFMISVKAIVLSILFFGILFLFVHRFNVKELKKMSLLDMIYADRKNETAIAEKNGKDMICMLISIFMMAGGYAVLFIIAEKSVFKALGIGGLLLIIGTLLFFTSVFKIMPKIMKLNKKKYFRGLNMFAASQLSSRAKSQGKSGAMISVLLFLSLSLSILGPGLGKFVMNGIENADPYDVTISYSAQFREEVSDDPMSDLKSGGFDVEAFSDSYVNFWTYQSPMVTTQLLGEKESVPLVIIGLDDYNRLLAQQNKDSVVLGENEYAIVYAFPPAEEKLKAFAREPKPLLIADTELTMAENGLKRNAWKNSNVLSDEGAVIVPQNIAEGLERGMWMLNFNFYHASKEVYDAFYEEWYASVTDDFILLSGEEAIISVTADNLLTTYLGIYLGITFLITSGAVLALQQLSQSADNIERYDLLRKLGASRRDLKRSLTKQLKVYFGLPMLIALLHTAVILFLTFRLFEGLALTAMLAIIGFGVMLILAVYGVYVTATYAGSRRMLQF